MTDERRDAPLTRYDFIPQPGRRVDFRISEYDGDWVRYADIKHLLVVTSRDDVLEEAAKLFDGFSYGAYKHPSVDIRALKSALPQGSAQIMPRNEPVADRHAGQSEQKRRRNSLRSMASTMYTFTASVAARSVLMADKQALDDAKVMVASVVNDPSDFSPQEDFNSLEFASYTDAKKAEVLFNRMQRTIDALRHDLERAMANHNADLNGDDARDAARYHRLIGMLFEYSLHFRSVGDKVQLCNNSFVLGEGAGAEAAIDAAMQRTKGSGG